MAKKARSKQKEKLFEETLVPAKPGSGRLFEASYDTDPSQPVECLGMTFDNDEARRQYFLEKLREKLQDPEFRQIEGFPIGEDEDILALSDPPYYSACPNPFLDKFISHYGHAFDATKDNYERRPFAADVREGKNDPIYNAHSYHTKVPHKAIMRYILHYTEPGAIVYDGFCGTGMTGVAAQLCGSREEVESLGYNVTKTGTILNENNVAVSRIGFRPAIVSDLAPIATFISRNLLSPLSRDAFISEAKIYSAQPRMHCQFFTLSPILKRKGVENLSTLFGAISFSAASAVVKLTRGMSSLTTKTIVCTVRLTVPIVAQTYSAGRSTRHLKRHTTPYLVGRSHKQSSDFNICISASVNSVFRKMQTMETAVVTRKLKKNLPNTTFQQRVSSIHGDIFVTEITFGASLIHTTTTPLAMQSPCPACSNSAGQVAIRSICCSYPGARTHPTPVRESERPASTGDPKAARVGPDPTGHTRR